MCAKQSLGNQRCLKKFPKPYHEVVDRKTTNRENTVDIPMRCNQAETDCERNKNEKIETVRPRKTIDTSCSSNIRRYDRR